MFNIDQKELLKAVKIVSSIIKYKNVLPNCFEDITFTYMKEIKGVKLFASVGGELSIAYYLTPYDVEEFKSVRVNAKKLLNCIDSFDKDCKLEITQEDYKLKIKECTNRKNSYSNLKCDSLDNYPELELLSNNVIKYLHYYTDEKTLKELIKSSLFAIADSSDGREVLKGGLFELENKFFRVVTANGQMCCVVGSKGDKISKTENFEKFILPENTLIKLEKLLSSAERHVSIFVSKEKSGDINKVEFMFNDIVLQSRVINGAYPNWRQMRVSDGCCDYRIFLDKEEMQKICVKHQKFFNGIKDEKPKNSLNVTNFELVVNTDKLIIKSKDYNNESSIVDDIGIEEIVDRHKVIDNIFNINLDVDFMFNIIKSINNSRIYMKMKEDNRQPIEIIGETPDKFTCILMPIRVK
jgi:DNA polymerase III sliding clamp (beta) subunit (PCNA family)